MATRVESAIASISPKPKSGVDWRSAVQLSPKPNDRLVGSQIGSVVEKVVRSASSFWHPTWAIGCVIWHPSGVASTPVGKIVVALLLRAEPQDVVGREDVHRAARGVLPDAHLVDGSSRPAQGGLEVTAAARAGVEDRSERGQPLGLGEVDLPVGEQLEVVASARGHLADDAEERRRRIRTGW